METLRQPSPTRLLATGALVLALAGFSGFAAGCKRTQSRPASSLSDQNRVVLDAYEHIRAALAQDDYVEARRYAQTLADTTKPSDPNQPPSSIYIESQFLAEASAMDRQREQFRQLSESVLPLVAGVEGFYVVRSPVDPKLVWVQRSPDVDNPYMGKVMHDSGTIQK